MFNKKWAISHELIEGHITPLYSEEPKMMLYILLYTLADDIIMFSYSSLVR